MAESSSKPLRAGRLLAVAAPIAGAVLALHAATLLAGHHAYPLLAALLAPALAIVAVALAYRLARGRRTIRSDRLLFAGPFACGFTVLLLALEWSEQELLPAGHTPPVENLLSHALPVAVAAGVAIYAFAVLHTTRALLDFLGRADR